MLPLSRHWRSCAAIMRSLPIPPKQHLPAALQLCDCPRASARQFGNSKPLHHAASAPAAAVPGLFGDATLDCTFKTLFKSKPNEDLLISFLNSVLQRDDTNSIVDLIDAELTTEFSTEKASRLDVFCKDKQGYRFVIEMQKSMGGPESVASATFHKRVLFYGYRVYDHQLKPSDSFRDLKPLICITITDSKSNSKVISEHHIVDIESRERNLKDIAWIFVALPNFIKEISECKTELDEWMFLLRNSAALQSVPSDIKSKVIQKVYTVLERSKWTDEQLSFAHTRDLIYQLDQTTAKLEIREAALEKGKKIGLRMSFEEGKKIEQKKLASKLLKEGTLSRAQVAEVVELTEDEMNKL